MNYVRVEYCENIIIIRWNRKVISNIVVCINV